MTLRPLAQAGHTMIRATFPNYDATYHKASEWVEKKVSIHLPQSLIHTVDKIIFIVDSLIPNIIAIGSAVLGGFAFQVSLSSMAPGLIPLLAWSLHNIFSNTFYPYDYLKDLNQASLRGHLPSIHPNVDLQNLIAMALTRNGHVMLTGPAGCGKTTTILSLAQLIESEKCPPNLKYKRIYHLDMNSILSNPNDALLRFTTFINEITSNPDIILFIDQAHRINDRVNGVRLSDFLTPLLEMKAIQVIAATTSEKCAKLFKDATLARSFIPLSMTPLTLKDYSQIIQTHFQTLPQHLRPTTDAINKAIQLGPEKYPNIALPACAFKILDPTINWKYSAGHLAPITCEDIEKAVQLGLIEAAPVKEPSFAERTAIAAERTAAATEGFYEAVKLPDQPSVTSPSFLSPNVRTIHFRSPNGTPSESPLNEDQ